jgi:hypothetical protein
VAKMGSTAPRICAAVFYRPVLIIPRWSFAGPKRAGQGGTAMDDREELRRLIDVIEKGSGTGRLEQAVDDIKTFTNAASFLTNKLDTRLKGGDVKAKGKPKSRIGNAIAAPPKSAAATAPSSPTEPSSANTSGMPTATSTSTSQADFERLKPQGSQPPVGAS